MVVLDEIVQSYYANNARKLHKVVDKVLLALHFIDVDKEEYYSLANEVFTKAIHNYDHSKPFDKFIYSCLYKKFCTDMTGQTRNKRCTKIKVAEKDLNGNIVTKVKIIHDERMDRPVSDENDSTFGELIKDKKTVESELFGEEIGYSNKMNRYLDRLSILQKKVLMLRSINYSPDEIMQELHINKRQYDDCIAGIKSPRNIKLLL